MLKCCCVIASTATSFSGEYLNITRVTREDMTAYLCIAHNGVLPSVSKRILLQVNCEYRPGPLASSLSLRSSLPQLVRPKIHVPNQLVPAYQGTDVELECRVEAFPRPEAIWLFGEGLNVREMLAQYEKHARESEHLNALGEADLGGEERPRLLTGPSHGPNWQKYSFDEVQEGYRMTMRLTIRRLELYDYGSYKCVARNNLGEKEGVVRLYRKLLCMFLCIDYHRNMIVVPLINPRNRNAHTSADNYDDHDDDNDHHHYYHSATANPFGRTMAQVGRIK